jgi:hypothetical protein
MERKILLPEGSEVDLQALHWCKPTAGSREAYLSDLGNHLSTVAGYLSANCLKGAQSAPASSEIGLVEVECQLVALIHVLSLFKHPICSGEHISVAGNPHI